MRVYRVEHIETKYGPYSEDSNWTSGSHNASTGRPAPWEDIADWYNRSRQQTGEMYFGFECLAQLLAWFTADERKTLSYRGFTIAVYEVPDHLVLKGTYQLCFLRKCAGMVDRLDINLNMEEVA